MIRATRNMLDFFERKGMKYSPDSDTTKGGDDVGAVTYSGDYKDSSSFGIFVDPDEDNVAIRVWTIAKTTNTRQVAAVSLVLNDLNNNYRWYRWYLDDDREVTAAVDAVITADTIGAIAYELVQRGVNIIDENYPKVMKALWSDQ